MVLGLPLDWTVGEIREDILSQVKQALTAGGAAMGALRQYRENQARIRSGTLAKDHNNG